MLKPLLLGLLVPALVCGGFLLAAGRSGRDGNPRWGGWGGIGLTLGYLIAHVAVAGWPPWRPVDVTDWLPHVAVAALVVALVSLRWPRAVRLHRCLCLAAAAGAVVVVTLPMIRHTWTPARSVAGLIALSLTVFAMWTSLSAVSRRVSGAGLAVTLLVVTTAGSVALVLSRTAKLSQLCAALAAMAGAGLVIAWCKRGSSLGAGAAGVAALLMGYLWIEGWLYAELPAASAVLLAAAPSAAWIWRLTALRRLAPWQVVCVQAGAVLLPAAAGVAIAVIAGANDEYYGY
ncbi:MAG: hypothetical protein ACYSU7_01445 [Planctomycetota bacterium]|jgi:hypothetical protein